MSVATIGAVDYTKALDGLSLKQAQLMLTTQGMNAEEQKTILLQTGLIASSDNISAKLAYQALTTTSLSTAEKQQMMIELGLMDRKTKSLIVTNHCTEAELRAQLTKKGYIGTSQDEIVTSILGTSVREKEAISWNVLWTSIKKTTAALAEWLVTNPFGWATIAIGAVAGLVKGYDALIGRQEKLARTKIEGLNEDISEYDAEISSLIELQTKLESAKGEKAELAKIQTELNEAIGDTPGLLNGESKAWDAANVKIQANIDLLKQQRKEAQQDKVNASKELFDNNNYEVDWNFDITGDQMKYVMANYQKYLNAYKEMDEESIEWAKKVYGDFENAEEYAIKRLNYGGIQISDTTKLYTNISQSELESYWKEQIDVAYDVFEDTINSYDGAGGQNFLKNLISNMVKGGSDLSDISTAVTQVIENEDMQNAINDYWESLVDPNIDSEKALSKVKSIFDGIVAQFPELAGFFDSFYNQIATSGSNAAKSVETNANKMTDSLDSLSSAIKAAEDAFELFNEVEKDFNSTGAISAENIQKILNKFPELEDELYEYIIGMRSGASVMDLLKTKSDDMATMSIKAFKRMYLSSNSVSKDIKDDYESAFKLIGLEWDNTQSVMANVNTQIVDANGQATQTFVDQWTEACKLAGANVSTFAQGISALLGGDFYDGTSGVYRVQGKGIYYKDGSGMDGKGTNLVNVKAMELIDSGQFANTEKGRSDAYKAAYNILSNQMDKSWENQAEFERRQKEFEERMKQYAVTSDDKSGSDKNEALDNYLKDAENRYKVHQDEIKYIQELQWAHNNLTKSDKERLDITGKINEAYRDLADNRIKDLQHQIDLKKELYGEDYNSISELEEIQRVAHEEAERLRKMGYDNNSNEIQALQKTWWDAENQKLDEYSKQHEKRVRDIEHSRDMALNNNPDINTSDYYKQLQEEYHKEAERLRALDPEKYKEEIQELQQLWWDAQESIRDENRKEFDNRMELSEDYIQHSIDFGWENGDNEIAARKRVLDWIESDYYKSLIDDDKEYYKILEENRLKYIQAQGKEFDKANDFGSSILDSRKTLLQSYFDVTNSISEAQHEINKELETSKIMYEWLDEDTRKLLFNQEDYNTLSKELIDIQSEADRLQRQYEYDLRNSTLETVESITSQYQMQYETLMKSYEIAKADLDIAKKKQKLNNVLNERNVRMRIDGQWQWVANTEDVANAKAELADAEYAKRVAESGLVQQQSINDLTKRQDELGVVIKKFEGGVIDLGEAVRLAKEAIGSLPYALSSMYSNVGSSSSKSSSSGSYNNTKSYNGTSYDPNVDYSAEMKNYEKGSAKWNLLNKRRNAKIAGEGLSYDPFASGTRCTPSGNVLMGEKEPEIFIDNNGHLIPINQPTFANIGAGGVVFNQNQLSNLRSLWDLSNIGTMPTHNISNITSRQISETNTYQMYGNMVFDGNNPEEVFKQFCDFMKHNRYKSK